MAINKISVKAFTAGDLSLDTFVATAGQTVFTLAITTIGVATIVTVNDVLQVPGSDYNVNGTTLTFTSALTLNDTVVARTISQPSVYATVEDGAINTAKIAPGAIEGRLGYTPVAKTTTTGSATITSGTTSQRDVAPQAGYFRFNITNLQFEGYTGSNWIGVAGVSAASGASGNPILYENDSVITGSYTIGVGKNASSTGPLTINSGVTVTLPAGSRWIIL